MISKMSGNGIKEILSSVQFKVRYISVAPNMDLVLIVSEAEEVLAYRFIQNWVKVWSCFQTAVIPGVSDSSQKSSIIGVAWEPCGKYCVVGHSSGLLAICDVESGAIFIRIELALSKYEEKALTAVQFSNITYMKSDTELYDSIEPPGDLIPKYSFSSLPDEQFVIFRALQRHLLDGPSEQSYLACFGKNMNIYLLAGGFVLLAVIQLGPEISPLPLINCHQFDCHAPSGSIAAVCEYKMRNTKSFCVYMLSSELICSNHPHVSYLARSLTDLIGSQEMAGVAISHLSEGLESVLFEFGSKLDNLAASKKTANSGLISTDFIQLLLLGRCSAETEQFFTLNLGERGMQRLSNSLQKNFGGLLKQSISTLSSVADRMVLITSRLASLLKFEQKLGTIQIGVSSATNLAADMYRAALQFRLKIAQLHSIAQQDIGELSNFVKFIQFEMNYLTAKEQRDSSVASQRLEGANKDLPPLTGEEIKSVVSFIQRNFVEDYENGKCKIKFERIAQFFNAEAVIDTDAIMQNPWVSFMLDIETTPLIVGGTGANDIAADLEAIMPKSDLEFNLVKSLQSFSLSLKQFISELVVALSPSYNADWCCKLPIANLGSSVVSARSDYPLQGAFVDRESNELYVLRVDLRNHLARAEILKFAYSVIEETTQLKVNHVLPAKNSSKPGLGIYVVLENVKNGENFGQSFMLSDDTVEFSSEEDTYATFKKLNAIPACVLLPPTVSIPVEIDTNNKNSKYLSFGRLNANDRLFIASTGRSLIILQPGFQLLRAFPGIGNHS